MHRLFFTIKAFITAAVIIGCLIFVYLILNSPVFMGGERYEFYTGTSSEEIVLARSPLEKLTLKNLTGESVRYRGDRVEELLSRFGAEVLFIEEAAGVMNYYCYSPVLKEAVILNGQLINLHIALSCDTTAAGTPIIFGGF